MNTVNFKSRIVDGVYILVINIPGAKLNTLTPEVRNEFDLHLQEISSNPNVVAAVLRSGKVGCFIAGADISVLTAPKSAEEMEASSRKSQEFCQRIEDCKKPIVAAIQGYCFGGGMEVALACHYRMAAKDRLTRMALPEVSLGICPGAGGTQRMPRTVGLRNGLEMILTAKRIDAEEAKRIGLVDQVVNLTECILYEGNALKLLEGSAVNAAKSLANGSLKVRKRGEAAFLFKLTNFFFRRRIFEAAKEQTLKATGGFYPAPLKALEVIQTGIEKGLKEGLRAERKAFGQLMVSSESRSLVGLFIGQKNCRRNRFGKPGREIQKIGIVGAGLMGAGIAKVSIDKGWDVVLKDTDEKALERGMKRIRNGLEADVARGKIDEHEKERILSTIDTTLDYENFSDCDLVIEAVFEDVDLKRRVISELESITPAHCIIATNTSAIPIAKIASASTRPEKIVGMHYFSPVEKMQLLEIVTTPFTSPEATAAAAAVGLKQGKVVITVKDGPGFYTTRIFSTLSSEATRLMQEGVNPGKLDAISKAFGFPMGMASLVDQIGLDTGAKIAGNLTEEFGERFKGGDLEVMREMVENGCAGKKSGAGIYKYDASKTAKMREINPVAVRILRKYGKKPKAGCFSDEDKQMRMVARFVNEAVLCLEEGILPDVVQGDVGAVFGLGFPPFRGGPFRYVDDYGADKLVKKMKRYEGCYGVAFAPAQTLLDMAKDSGKKFYGDSAKTKGAVSKL